jgi:hypothetical protein
VIESVWLELSIAGALFTGLLGAFHLSYWVGSRAAAPGGVDAGPLGTIQGAVLGLLGLLLGFSFAGAAGRFIERQDVIVSEANAIGTAYLRADLLDEPFRGELRTALRDYTASRVAIFEAQGHGSEGFARAEERSAALHPQGYGFGLARRRHSVLACAVAFLVAATLWLAIDLDSPSRGLIRIGERPMLELAQSLATP